VTLDRMRTEFNVEGVMGQPQVAYRETITKPIQENYTHKKQTGGSGQFAEVWIKFEPLERSAGFVFEDKTVGGSVPREYVPSVEKGLKMQLEEGVLAKFPTVDFKATLVDGSYHDVDSNALTFEIAAKAAFREAMKKAGPILLEPVMKVEVVTPDNYLGDVIGDLNRRRGQITGMEDSPSGKSILAQVPLSEMFGYATTVRSMSQGRATFTMEFEKYMEVPPNVADSIIKN
jgi:elongation factor G